MSPLELKKRLRADAPVIGTLVVSPSPVWPRVIGDCGLDFLFIDTEHTALNRESVSWMCRTYRAMGLPPLVRITGHDPDLATVALDDGAAGVIVPYVESVETVRQMVGATKFRPLKGRRLAETLDGAELEEPLAGYLANRNEDHLLIVNIESTPALEALDGILEIDGLDAVLIGPHDLSTSLGVPEQYDHPRFLEACREILGKARKAGIGAGIHHWLAPDEQIQFLEMGANLLIHKADITLVHEGLRSEVAALRERLGLTTGDRDDQETVSV